MFLLKTALHIETTRQVFHVCAIADNQVAPPAGAPGTDAAAAPDRAPGRRVARRHKLILVSAPAGYGKTTLIADWLVAPAPSPSPKEWGRAAGPGACWLSLDESDNDPARFIFYLLAALRQIDPTIGQAAQAMLQIPGSPQVEAALTGLINDIAARPRPFFSSLTITT